MPTEEESNFKDSGDRGIGTTYGILQEFVLVPNVNAPLKKFIQTNGYCRSK